MAVTYRPAGHGGTAFAARSYGGLVGVSVFDVPGRAEIAAFTAASTAATGLTGRAR